MDLKNALKNEGVVFKGDDTGIRFTLADGKGNGCIGCVLTGKSLKEVEDKWFGFCKERNLKGDEINKAEHILTDPQLNFLDELESLASVVVDTWEERNDPDRDALEMKRETIVLEMPYAAECALHSEGIPAVYPAICSECDEQWTEECSIPDGSVLLMPLSDDEINEIVLQAGGEMVRAAAALLDKMADISRAKDDLSPDLVTDGFGTVNWFEGSGEQVLAQLLESVMNSIKN